jgi:hypothetical protein
MSRQIIKTEKPGDHPLEDVLDIESGSTMIEYNEPAQSSDPVIIEGVYDEKDKEIEEQFQEVYEAAMLQFEVQTGVCDDVEGKYAARNAEVAVQFLTAALSAVQAKSGVKSNKDKLLVKAMNSDPVSKGKNIVLDRNELMKMLEKK